MKDFANEIYHAIVYGSETLIGLDVVQNAYLRHETTK